jgi:hypothetical protein
MGSLTYIVICQSVVGNPETGYTTEYNWDGMRFATSKSAISHGFEVRDSDDFNIGVLRGDTLTEFRWMDKPMDEEYLDEIAERIGLEPSSV